MPLWQMCFPASGKLQSAPPRFMSIDRGGAFPGQNWPLVNDACLYEMIDPAGGLVVCSEVGEHRKSALAVAVSSGQLLLGDKPVTVTTRVLFELITSEGLRC